MFCETTALQRSRVEKGSIGDKWVNQEAVLPEVFNMNDSVMKTKRDPMQFYPAKKDSRKRKWFYQKVKLPPINITSIDGPCHTIINSADFFICLKMLIIR